MKAYINFTSEQQNRMGEFLACDTEYIFTTFITNSKSIDKLNFDLDRNYEKGKSIDFNGSIGVMEKTIKAFATNQSKKLYSYFPFINIVNFIKIFDEKINEMYKQDEELASLLSNPKNEKREYYYKSALYFILTKYGSLFNDVITFIGQYMTTYGFIKNISKNEKSTNQCNIFNLLYDFYCIYEAFYLFKYLNKESLENKVFLSIHYNSDIDDKEVKNRIDNILKSFERTSGCIHHSKYNENSYCWEPILIFDNSLALAVYELRMQLSQNSDTHLIVCQNPLCNKTITAYHKGQKYCIDDNECFRTRQNLRKKKSNQIKKTR